jgi:hypothetical protein
VRCLRHRSTCTKLCSAKYKNVIMSKTTHCSLLAIMMLCTMAATAQFDSAAHPRKKARGYVVAGFGEAVPSRLVLQMYTNPSCKTS